VLRADGDIPCCCVRLRGGGSRLCLQSEQMNEVNPSRNRFYFFTELTFLLGQLGLGFSSTEPKIGIVNQTGARGDVVALAAGLTSSFILKKVRKFPLRAERG
jgi:hypothetical protein